MSAVADTSDRPSRHQLEPAVLDLVRRRGAEILATARRYAATPEDAEDAYQRGLEIMLTKAPSTDEDDLVPWLKTVVKHEAFALAKQRARHGVPVEQDTRTPAPVETHEHVERLDRLQRGAEALRRLKPQEMRCMLLLAEGYSYQQICEITGFSYTKVNRCLAEGRQSFLRRVESIEAGDECARLAPLVSAAADGEATAEDMIALRRHMRGCLACRAALREARQVPARVAVLAPAGIALGAGGADGAVAAKLHAAWGWLHERLAALAVRGHEAAEVAGAHKTVAVAASAAALAGGGAATLHTIAAPSHAPARPAASAVHRTPAPPLLKKPRLARRPAPKRAPHPHNPRPVVVRTPASAPPRSVSQSAPPPPTAPVPPSRAPAPQPAPAPRAQQPASGEFGP